MGPIDNKVAWATAAVALNGLFWFLWQKFEWLGVTWTTDELATVMGFTGTILAFVGGWFFRNAASPLPEESIAPPLEEIPPISVGDEPPTPPPTP